MLLIREWITQFTNANHATEIKERERENEKGALNQRRRSFSGVLRILAAQRETGAASS